MTRSEFLEQASKQFEFLNYDLEKENVLKRIRDWSQLNADPEFVTDFLFGGGINGCLYFHRFEKISDDMLVVHVGTNYHVEYWTDIGQYAASIAYIENFTEIIEEFYLSEDLRFWDNQHKLRFQNEDELFDYLLTAEFDHHPVITEKTYEMLRHFGWYEGRHVDISPLETELQKRGISLSQIQRDAISEFSGLEFGFSDCALDHNFYSARYMIENLAEIEFEPEIRTLRSQKLIGKNALEIGNNDREFVCISDDGKIFINGADPGARNILEYIYRFCEDLPENVK